MAEKPSMLLLDDEPEILNALKRLFRKEYNVDIFTEGHEALEALKSKEYPIIISDMRMPQLDGAAFLSEAKQILPESSRILLTGYADMESTVRAINDGEIFSYVSKPWDNTELKVLAKNAMTRYELLKKNDVLSGKLVAANTKLSEANSQLTEANAKLEERIEARTAALNKQTMRLKQSTLKQRKFFRQLIDMISVIIEDRAGHENGHSKRVAAHSKVLAEELGLSRAEAINIYLTGMLHEVGKVSISDELLATTEVERNPEQQQAFKSHAVEGANILSRLPSLREVAVNIRHQYENWDGSGFPDSLKKEDIPMGARILKVVSDYDYLILGHKSGQKLSPDRAQFYLKEERGKQYDYKIVDKYLSLLERLPEIDELEADYCVATSKLEPGMIVSADVVTLKGSIMLTKDTELTESAINKLKAYEEDNECFLTVFIY